MENGDFGKEILLYKTTGGEELPVKKEGFMQILHKTSPGGGRPVAIYNLDVLISVGYRVKSPEGVRFRQWARPRQRPTVNCDKS